MKKTELRGRKVSRARLRIQTEEGRLRSALGFHAGAANPVHVGDVDCLSCSEVEGPLLVAVYERGWTIKVGSIVEEPGPRIQISTTSSVPLLECPSNLVIRFGLGEELSRFVDHVIASEFVAVSLLGCIQ